MRLIELKVPTFFDSDLPDMQRQPAGFSLYRGVLVQWDEDRDDRVLDFLDALPAAVLDSLVIIQEARGMLAMRWANRIPTGYTEGSLVDVTGDLWTIGNSRAIV